MKSHVFAILIVAACWAVAPVRFVNAQETINYASVSGRVVDPQGAVVRGAQVSARQTETNVTAQTVSDSEGRFRFPYLKIGPYELKVSTPGFADNMRTLTLTVGAAFDVQVALAVAGVDATVAVRGRGDRTRGGPEPDCRHGPAGRGAEPADERAELPRSGAADSRRVPDEHQQHAAVRRRRRRCPARGFPCRASATCRTTSSSTACRPTTTRRA